MSGTLWWYSRALVGIVLGVSALLLGFPHLSAAAPPTLTPFPVATGVPPPRSMPSRTGIGPVSVLSLVVGTTADDAGTATSNCTTLTNTDCSLRSALTLANANPGSTITVPGGTYTLTHADGGDATSGLLASASVTIAGAGAASTIIQAAATPNTATYRVLEITGANVAVSGVTLRNGVAIVSNTRVDGGGGVRISAAGARITDSVISGNTVNATNAQGSGGGLDIESGDATLLRTTVSGNTVTVTRTSSFGSPFLAYGGGCYSSGPLTITDSTVSGNAAQGTAGDGLVFVTGGGIAANSSLMVTGSTISGNTAGTSGGGGGIMNFSSPATVTRSTLSTNTAQDGGGILNQGGLTVTNSTFAGNSAGNGGGIANLNGLKVTNSTFSGNSASDSGGGIYNNSGGTLTVTNGTLTGNSGNVGGGIFNEGTTVVTNTIVAGNTTSTTGPDIHGAVASGGHNLVGSMSDASGITNGLSGDIVNPAPRLGPLADNGGPTQTVALLDGSPAIGHGNPSLCAATGAGFPQGVDERGSGRPPDTCAIGAVEPHSLATIQLPSGTTAGNTVVTLTGLGFMPGATVRIGGVPCTNVNVVSSTILRCTTGAHGAGTVDVTVVSGGATNMLVGAYTYGVVNTLPANPPPSGGANGSPIPLPGQRQPGGSSGAPDPLPPARP